MKKLSFFALTFGLFLVMITFFSNQLMVYAQETGSNSLSQTYYEGVIKEVRAAKTGKTAVVQITKGSAAGKNLTVQILPDAKTVVSNYKAQDKVIVIETKGVGQNLVYIADYVRTDALFVLFVLFCIIVGIIGGKHGLLAVVGMFYSFIIVGRFIVPNIILGNDPIFISLLGGLLISPVSFYISHGFNWKTTIAIIGTLISLIITGILSIIFVNYANLMGTASDDTMFITTMVNTQINLKSLLLAGMIIASFGILDDITVSQASIVNKLIQTGKEYSFKEVFTHGMDIGKDHIASLVNTLVLVYAGASLPLFLLFYNSKLSYSVALSSEIVATEIVRTLVGSIGLVVAVPITTALAAIMIKKDDKKK